ncbi:GspE/PulE family protein [Aliidiomarina celeris]|uniref:GspE/PulE family protein n=1 Tax=Aliidiomarina celeris TaxID=2249428 RepID=UPI000DE91939|nr:ATPase, T2SS/T4P/T4SS family [Aliidiomarina celeris]
MSSAAQLPPPLTKLLADSVLRGVSDLHFEAMQDEYRVRQRYLGHVQPLLGVSKLQGEQWLAALKNAAGTDVTQRRKAQDGRFLIHYQQLRIDCRLNVLPTLWGEKIVLRLFNQTGAALTLAELGLLPEQLQLMQQSLQDQQGLILVTGPTGSGKTRTLYAMIEALKTRHINISTVEDPVEIPIQGVNQTAVNQHSKLTFAATLRALLRQDPDVIMVGEIRDPETAEMTLQAAQTGHLVLATLHASHAIAAIIRLQQLGVSHAQLAAALNLLINQRLINLGHKRTGVFELLHVGERERTIMLASPNSNNYWQQLHAMVQGKRTEGVC